jgi:hypothetical protein
MLTTIFRCLILATLALVASPALAWNALGHKTVAEIAWRQLEPERRQEIVDTLRRHPRFDDDFAQQMPADVEGADKETQDHWVFQQAAYWPDVARGIKGDQRRLFDRPSWHYVNGPIFVDRSDRRALAGQLRVNTSDRYPTNESENKWNILQAIKHWQAVLRDKRTPTAERAVAYCWLFHLVGDSHQPLHSCALFSASRFPEGDRGGNSIPLVRGDNLHSLWDNLLGRQHYMRNVDKAVAELSDKERFGDVWESAGKERNARKWIAESFDLAKDFAYDPLILDVVRRATPQQPLERIDLTDAYLKQAGEHARRRVVAAGVRLGEILGGEK